MELHKQFVIRMRKLFPNVYQHKDQLRAAYKQPPMSFEEACLKSHQPHVFFLQNLLQSNCINAANFFKMFFLKDDYVVKNKIVRNRLSNNPTVVRIMFHHILQAELLKQNKIVDECNKHEEAIRHYYDAMKAIFPLRFTLTWALSDFYTYVSNQFDEEEVTYSTREVWTRIFLLHANFMMETNNEVNQIEKAIEYYERAFNLSRTRYDVYIDNELDLVFDYPPEARHNLHSLVVYKLLLALDIYSKFFPLSNIEMIDTITNKIKAIAELAHFTAYKLRAQLLRIRCCIEDKQYGIALFYLVDLEKEFYRQTKGYDLTKEYHEILAQIYLWRAICLIKTENFAACVPILWKVVKQCQDHDFKEIESDAHYQLGLTYERLTNMENGAKLRFARSLKLAEQLNDEHRKEKAQLGLASLKARRVKAIVLEEIKREKEFEHFNNLFNWKLRLEEFWKEYEDYINQTVGDVNEKKPRSSFKRMFMDSYKRKRKINALKKFLNVFRVLRQIKLLANKQTEKRMIETLRGASGI